MLELICPQCQGQLTEVLDSDGGLFICRADFHGKVAPSFTRETLEVAQGIIFVPSQPLPVKEVRPTPRALDGALYWGCSNCGSANSAVNSVCAECKTPRQ